MTLLTYYPGLSRPQIDHMPLLELVKYCFGVLSRIEDEMLINSPSMGGDDAQREWDKITQTRKEQAWNNMFPKTKFRPQIKEMLAEKKRKSG